TLLAPRPKPTRAPPGPPAPVSPLSADRERDRGVALAGHRDRDRAAVRVAPVPAVGGPLVRGAQRLTVDREAARLAVRPLVAAAGHVPAIHHGRGAGHRALRPPLDHQGGAAAADVRPAA